MRAAIQLSLQLVAEPGAVRPSGSRLSPLREEDWIRDRNAAGPPTGTDIRQFLMFGMVEADPRRMEAPGFRMREARGESIPGGSLDGLGNTAILLLLRILPTSRRVSRARIPLMRCPRQRQRRPVLRLLLAGCRRPLRHPRDVLNIGRPITRKATEQRILGSRQRVVWSAPP